MSILSGVELGDLSTYQLIRTGYAYAEERSHEDAKGDFIYDTPEAELIWLLANSLDETDVELACYEGRVEARGSKDKNP